MESEIHRIKPVGKPVIQTCPVCGRLVRVINLEDHFVCAYCKRKQDLQKLIRENEVQ